MRDWRSIFPASGLRLKPMFALALAYVTVVALSSCKRDPFDRDVIARDLESVTVNELYEKAADMPWTPPADKRLTAPQIASFIRVSKLAAAIREVAGGKVNELADRAATEDSSFHRVGDAFAAVGTMRAYATAQMRASINLGENPNEQQWIDRQIALTTDSIRRLSEFDRELAGLNDELAGEDDSVIRARIEERIEEANDRRAEWEEAQDAAVLANARLVMQRHAELEAVYPLLLEAKRNP